MSVSNLRKRKSVDDPSNKIVENEDASVEIPEEPLTKIFKLGSDNDVEMSNTSADVNKDITKIEENSTTANNSTILIPEGGHSSVLETDKHEFSNEIQNNTTTTNATNLITEGDHNSVLDTNKVLSQIQSDDTTSNEINKANDDMHEIAAVENNVTANVECDGEEINDSNSHNTENDTTDTLENNSENADNKEDVLNNDNSNETITDDILITIHFKSKKITEIFKEKILNAMKVINEFSVIDKTLIDNKLVIKPNVQSESELLKEIFDDKTKKKRKKFDKKSVKDDIFTLDTTPSFNKNNIKLQYLTKFSLENSDKSEKTQEEGLKFSTINCFNCSKSHNLRDCPYPKDFLRINKAKSKISKLTRYHLEGDKKNEEAKPGKISQKLIEALGIYENQLPPYIYKMRELGYPPGWVEEVFEVSSQLALFDSDGKNLNGNVKNEIKINPDKIIEYPGFNAPMDKRAYDDYKNYGAVKYSNHINKDSIMEAIKKCKDNHENCDMEIDCDEEQNIVPPGCEENLNPRLSPTLNDLEEEKLKLLAELSQGETVKIVNKPEVQKDVDVKTEEENSNKNHNVQANVKASTFGTPILDRKYPFAKLPHLDNFSTNVTPVIYFENLPNSTGKFEQMSGLLQKVRKTLKDNELKL